MMEEKQLFPWTVILCLQLIYFHGGLKQHRNGLLPYLLPFPGPLLILLIILSIGPVLFNTIMASIKQQIEALKVHPIQVHYKRLKMVSQDYE